tara:strand:+ start:14923 stop:15522 length:600 start_codon:yes stop_codon:yes gene_type:complete
MEKDTYFPFHKLWCKEGHFNNDQCLVIENLVKEHQPKYCLETGFCTGRSALSVLNSSDKIEKFITIDVNFDYRSEGRKYKELFKEEYAHFKAIEEASRKIFNKEFFQKEYPNGIDWFTVDGDHSQKGCYNDIHEVLPYMNEGSIIIIDDYKSGPPNGCSIPSVTKACEAIFEKYEDIIERTEWNEKGKGFCIFKIAREK